MRLFGRKRQEEVKDGEGQKIKKIKDLQPIQRRRRKEPIRPWGKKERLLILFIFITTVAVSLLFSVSSGNFEFPSFPKFDLGSIFKSETIVIGNKESVINSVNRKKSEKIISQFISDTQNLSGKYAFSFTDLSTGFSFGVKENEVMQAASLIKLPLILYAQGKVDDSKIEAMGKKSDNNVFTELVNKFGKSTVQEYILSLGMTNTSLEDNSTTAKEIAGLFLKLYKDKEDKILGYLTDTIFEEWITKGIPEGIRVSHKYGREKGVVNDGGIVYAEKPFVLVLMSQEVDVTEADIILPKLAEMIYSEYEKIENVY